MLYSDFPLVLSDLDRSEILKKIISYVNNSDNDTTNESATLNYDFVKNEFKNSESFGNTSKTIQTAITTQRTTTATQFNNSRLLSSVAVDFPRSKFNFVTGKFEGLLCEQTSTNLLTHSNNMSDASWSKVAATITPNAGLAPDGSNTANGLFETAVVSQHILDKSVSGGATIYTVSSYVKANGRDIFILRTDDVGSVNVQTATFDLTNKTIASPAVGVARGTATILAPFLTELPNGWFHCGYTVSFSVAPATVRIRQYSSTELASSYVGDTTKGLLLWNPQLEPTYTATSLIPTTTATVSRTVDNYSITIPNISEGTLLIVASGTYPFDNVNQTLFSLSDNTADNSITVLRNNSLSGSQLTIVGGGVSQVLFNSTQKQNNVTTKFAISWNANSYTYAENGVVLSSGNVTSPTGLTSLVLGAGLSSANSLNGTIAKVVYIPKKLSDLDVQTISA